MSKTNKTSETKQINRNLEEGKQNKPSTKDESSNNMSSVSRPMNQNYNLIGTAFNIALNVSIYAFLEAANVILCMVKDELEAFVPTGNDVKDKEKLVSSILNRIIEIAKTPEFQEKWRELTRTMATLFDTMVNEGLDVIETEADDVFFRMSTIGKRVFLNAVSTGVDTAQDAMSLVPGLDAMIAMFNLVTSGVTNASNIILFGLEFYSNLLMLAEKVSGRTFGQVGDVIESIRGIVELVNSPENAANDAASNLNSTLQDINRDASIQIGNSLQSVATGKDTTAKQEQNETPSTEQETSQESTPEPSAPPAEPATELSPATQTGGNMKIRRKKQKRTKKLTKKKHTKKRIKKHTTKRKTHKARKTSKSSKK